MTKTNPRSGKARHRYGVGEWYGKSFVHLAPGERKRLARIQFLDQKDRPTLLCPFRSRAHNEVSCTKEGGVCSIRLYQQERETGFVSVPSGQGGSLATTCPYRFQQDGAVFKWIGETLLGHPSPLIVGELGFLELDTDETGGDDSQAEEVGRIDNVLVHPSRDPIHWCALEMQAVYFSGGPMSQEFRILRSYAKRSLPFPAAHRRRRHLSISRFGGRFRYSTLRRERSRGNPDERKDSS